MDTCYSIRYHTDALIENLYVDERRKGMNFAGVLPANNSLLSGVRVLDFTRALAGPFCGRLMADFGADVIKIEPPEGEASRKFPYITPEGVSGYFMQLNCGKKSISLDLSHDAGKQVIRDLVAVSDVVLENFRAGVLGRLGLGFDDLRKINPGLIMCSISGFGQNSSYAHRPAGDLVIQAMSGIASLTGDPDGPPQLVGMGISDTLTGLHAFGSINAALLHRTFSGQGEYIDCALLDTVMWTNEWASQHYFLSRDVDSPDGEVNPIRFGNRRPILVPGNFFKGKNGYITIVAASQAGWENVARAMGKPELVDDPRFSTRKACYAHRDELEGIVQEWVLSFDTVDEVEKLLADKSSVMAAKVRMWGEMLEDKHMEERELIAKVNDPVLGPVRVMNSPVRLRNTSAGIRGAAPRLGEHSLGILQSLLGYPQSQILDLINGSTLHADDNIMAPMVESLVGSD